MEKSWSQILNIYHSSNPHPLQTLFRGDRFVDICQNIRILLSTIAIQSLNMAFAIGIKVIKNKKRH